MPPEDVDHGLTSHNAPTVERDRQQLGSAGRAVPQIVLNSQNQGFLVAYGGPEIEATLLHVLISGTS